MQNRKSQSEENKNDMVEKKIKPITIYISSYGEAIDFSSFYNIPPAVEKIFPEFKEESCDSYNKVLTLLKKIKNHPECQNYIKIRHRHNSHYVGHNTNSKGFSHRESIDDMIAFVEKRKVEDKLHKSKQIGSKLLAFEQAILELESKLGKNPVIKPLYELHKTLTKEILEEDTYYPINKAHAFPMCPEKNFFLDDDKPPYYINRPSFNGPDLNKTFYPDVIDHFTHLTLQLSKHPQSITKEEIERSSQSLYSKLYDKPVSVRLKTAMSSAVGALVGFVVGAAASFWFGGIGAIPGAVVGAITGSSIGFFSGRQKQEAFSVKVGNTEMSKATPNSNTPRDTAMNTIHEMIEVVHKREPLRKFKCV